jgi:WD40 repeat protein/serine/threonine protein kinase
MSDRVETLFHQASDLPPDERRALLDAACREDPGLRAEVEGLLAEDARLRAEEGAGAFLDSPLVRSPNAGGAREDEGGGWPDPSRPAGSPDLSALRPPGPPVRVGHYRILRRIAEGGMGTVYEAEQDRPRRPVALKVVRPGVASTAVLKRFTHEAQILGRLHHPGVAQVYEAGLDEDGQPFFAMEFIRGLPLDEYADRHGLDLADRVGLVARVCDAVQHAHDQGVIHRDLKPANILVEETGQPKVLDFGVAHATDADLLTTAGLTQTGQLLGTPSYMSPEQMTADPAAIDHRADVYALGVILFELAAHRLPFQLEDRPLAEAARLILEQDPPQLGSIDPELRGDVETIVARALEKDPARRYPSAADLAADLRRWLAQEPILARPPSALYHLRKFASRNTGLVGGVAATGVALILGLVGTILFAVGEARQRGEAEHNDRQALIQTYRARLAAAGAALQNHDVSDAARQLDAAPGGQRGWEWRHLSSRLDDSSSVIALPGGVGFLVPGADRLRIGALDGVGLRLMDLDGGGQQTLPIGPYHGDSVTVTMTRRGLRVASRVGERAFELLGESGQVLGRVETPEFEGPGPVVSPDGTRLASRRRDGEWSRLAVFDAISGKQTAVCEGHHVNICASTFSPDGTRLATAGEDRTARLWDSATGRLLATCRGHASTVIRAAFRPDGARLVTASADGTVRQWDAATGLEIEAPYDRHSGEVGAAVYSPDGQWVASAGIDRTVRVWQATGRQDVAVLHGHTGAVHEVAFAPDGRRLASLSGSTAERQAAGWVADGTVRVWDVDPEATLPLLRGHTSYVYPVAFSPDGRWLASGGWDHELRLWDAATGAPCAVLPHPGIVPCLAFGPDGTWLVSGCFADGRLRIWDVETGHVRTEIRVPTGTIRSLTVSPDGKRVAATTYDEHSKQHHFHICDIASGKRSFSAEGWSLAYSPDGRWLAVLAADGQTVMLLDARTHEVVARFRGHEQSVISASFSPDSRRLASCGRDRTVRLWQIDGDACQVLRGHTDEVFATAFHPDGTRLATAGRDRAVWLWDLARGEEVARLQGHTSYVWSLAFSPDGTTLASGSGDFTVRLWDTTPLKSRYRARREAESLRPEAERLVELLWRQKHDPAEVVEALRADRALSEPLRQAALRAVLRRASPTETSPGNPP